MTDTKRAQDWHLFHGDGKKREEAITQLPAAPPWRQFRGLENLDRLAKLEDADKSAEFKEIEQRWQQILALAATEENKQGYEKGRKFRLHASPIQGEDSEEERGDQPLVNVADAVNAALYLRRPLLVTGNPGSGKTSLAYAIAYELQLGPVLTWSITTRSTLQEGLYRYDAIARLQDSQLPENQGQSKDIGQYITLGPVGTAFLPSLHPRVLLIDEIDKSDINLPNELLHLFEEGKYEIPELVRWTAKSSTPTAETDSQSVRVRTEDTGIQAAIPRGRVHCSSFPIVIMTSNAERDFPPAFVRRCLRVRMPDPDAKALKMIINAHFHDGNNSSNKITTEIEALIAVFLDKEERDRATDQLLNAIYIRNNLSPEAFTQDLQELLFNSLSAVDEL